MCMYQKHFITTRRCFSPVISPSSKRLLPRFGRVGHIIGSRHGLGRPWHGLWRLTSVSEHEGGHGIHDLTPPPPLPPPPSLFRWRCRNCMTARSPVNLYTATMQAMSQWARKPQRMVEVFICNIQYYTDTYNYLFQCLVQFGIYILYRSPWCDLRGWLGVKNLLRIYHSVWCVYKLSF